MDGNSDVLTRQYLDSLAIEWRHLGASKPDTKCTLFGRELASPIMAGGMAHYERSNPGGVLAFARGVKTADSVMWTGFCPDAQLDEILALGVPAGRIIKPFADRSLVHRCIEHDEKAGAFAFAMDVDHVFDKQGHIYRFFDEPLAPQGVESLHEYAVSTSLPFLVKGVLSVSDAKLCAQAGVAGVIISHHQNMFPWSVPPLKVLPEIKAAVGGQLAVVVDCGLETGFDVFKALALGADAVCVARPLLKAFAQGGEAAVSDYLTGMNDTLRCCLARTASSSISGIDPGVLREL